MGFMVAVLATCAVELVALGRFAGRRG